MPDVKLCNYKQEIQDWASRCYGLISGKPKLHKYTAFVNTAVHWLNIIQILSLLKV